MPGIHRRSVARRRSCTPRRTASSRSADDSPRLDSHIHAYELQNARRRSSRSESASDLRRVEREKRARIRLARVTRRIKFAAAGGVKLVAQFYRMPSAMLLDVRSSAGHRGSRLRAIKCGFSRCSSVVMQQESRATNVRECRCKVAASLYRRLTHDRRLVTVINRVRE